jgi:hypothetical protein
MIEGYGIFHLIHSLAVYKLVQVLVVALNVVTFYALLRQLRLSIGTSLAAVLVVLSTFQYRVYSDAILGFAISYPTILEADLLSFLLFAMYFNSGRRRDLVASIVLFAFALGLYETSYPLSLVFVFIALRLRRGNPLPVAAPFLALSAAFVGAELAMRHFIHMNAAAVYRLQLDPGAYLTTLAQQVTGAVPLTYLGFHGAELAARGIYPGAPWFLLAAAFVVAFAAGGLVLGKHRAEITGERDLWPLIGAGVALWILPAVLVSAIPRYQLESSWGVAYLPVYMSGFGFALAATAVGARLLRLLGGTRESWRWRIVAAGAAALFALVLSATYATNARVIDIFAVEKNGHTLVGATIGHGLLGRLSNGDTLFVNGATMELRIFGNFTDPSNYFRAQAGERWNVFPLSDLAQRLCRAPCRSSERGVYAMENITLDARSGYSVVGRVVGARPLPGESSANALVVDAQLLLTGPYLADPALDGSYAVQWDGIGCRGSGDDLPQATPLDRLPVLRAGPEWRVVALETPCSAIDLASVTIYSSR